MTPQELKNSILQLAIQGKLVEQRTEEGTGEELYQQIQAEKQRLSKARTIKKDKLMLGISEDEIPYDIPDNWMWVRIGSIGSWNAGATPSRSNPQYYNGAIPWLKTGDLNDGYITEVPEYISESAVNETSVQINPIGSVLMAMYGATIGKLGILCIEATTNQACCACYPLTHMFNKYLFYFLMANRKVFVKMGAGGAQPNISKEKIVNALMPLPPLAEQKRIVAKIEELLPHIDQYEESWRKLEDFNKRFPVDMQKSILQTAIQGKLVEQRPEEGTGEELYRQIQAEKQRLIKAGVIKKDKPLPEISEDEKPFDIPESWKWVRFGHLYSLSNGIASRGSKGGKPFPVLRLADLPDREVNTSNVRTIDLTEKEISSHLVQKDDLIFIRVNGSKDRVASAFRYAADEPMSYCDHLFCGNRISQLVFANYIMFVFNAHETRLQLIPEIKTTAGQNTISQTSMANIMLPLPPLAEQMRIVAKLEEILPLCEKLQK